MWVSWDERPDSNRRRFWFIMCAHQETYHEKRPLFMIVQIYMPKPQDRARELFNAAEAVGGQDSSTQQTQCVRLASGNTFRAKCRRRLLEQKDSVSKSLTVICPHCGLRQDLPYVFDGSYEVVCASSSCTTQRQSPYFDRVRSKFYVLIKNGSLHVWGNKEDLERFSK